MSAYLYLMAWNEILARVFDGFAVQHDASPPWLVNPSTRRRLKLDLLYDEINLAVRFVGLQVKGQGRKSDWEELEDAARDEVRKELCRLNGVELILLAPADGFPEEQFKRIGMALAGASRRVATRGRFQGKAALMERLSQARARLDEIRRQVHKPEHLAAYAELWRDREARAVAATAAPPARQRPEGARKKQARAFQVGQQVEHERYGPGAIIAVEAREDDVYITVQFVTAGERRFAASLAADKLAVKA